MNLKLIQKKVKCLLLLILLAGILFISTNPLDGQRHLEFVALRRYEAPGALVPAGSKGRPANLTLLSFANHCDQVRNHADDVVYVLEAGRQKVSFLPDVNGLTLFHGSNFFGGGFLQVYRLEFGGFRSGSG